MLLSVGLANGLNGAALDLSESRMSLWHIFSCAFLDRPSRVEEEYPWQMTVIMSSAYATTVAWVPRALL